MQHGRFRLIAVAAAINLVGLLAHAQDEAADTNRLVDALRLRAGSTVADIGAGDGALTIPVAAVVGPSGRVFATELPGKPIEQLRAIVARARAANVTVVEAAPAHTNLSPASCDAIFVRFVYHHFADPAAMNASLREALKPGGRLAVIEFAPNGPEAAMPAGRASGRTHGVTAATVTRELREAGFEVLSTEQGTDRRSMVVVEKPPSPQGAAPQVGRNTPR